MTGRLIHALLLILEKKLLHMRRGFYLKARLGLDVLKHVPTLPTNEKAQLEGGRPLCTGASPSTTRSLVDAGAERQTRQLLRTSEG